MISPFKSISYRVDVTDVFYNTAFEGEGMGEATIFSQEIIEGYSKY
jgi:hypothetical protein